MAGSHGLMEEARNTLLYGATKRVSFKPRADYRPIVSDMTLGK